MATGKFVTVPKGHLVLSDYANQSGGVTIKSDITYEYSTLAEIANSIGRGFSPTSAFGFGFEKENGIHGAKFEWIQNSSGEVSLKAEVSINGISGAGHFEFDENGAVTKAEGFAGGQIIIGDQKQLFGVVVGSSGSLEVGFFVDGDGIKFGSQLEVGVGVVLGEFQGNLEHKLDIVDFNEFKAERRKLSEHCFAAGVTIQMADGGEKPIEQVRTGDRVASFDSPNGERVASTVTQTFERPDQLVIDFHGTYVTPGHVYACPNGQYRMLIDILEQDGVIVVADGRHVRARTGYEVGSDEDAIVMAGIVQDDGDIKSLPVRAGTIVGTDDDGRPVNILEYMDDIGWRLDRGIKGFKMRDFVSPEGVGFPWHYAGIPFDPRLVAEHFAEYRQGRIRVAKGRPVLAEDRQFRGSIPERFITAH